MAEKIIFIVNNLEEFQSKTYIKKYLSNVDYTIRTSFPKDTSKYHLVILWNYRKIIKNIVDKNKIILFHSSDLPKGKGWAPIYHAIYNEDKYYTISGIFAANKVDSGDIIIQAKFRIRPNYTAEYLRKLDDEISIMMIKKILKKFKNKKIEGKKQKGKSTYYKRRKLEDNELKGKKIINHLRACEKHHPAFFYYKKEKFIVTIHPEKPPTFPSDLQIIFQKK
jgi:methionyl-tRNA formyltransferase